MSKWTEVRDSVVSALSLNDVTEQVKEDMTTNILNEVIPAIEDIANAFVGNIQSQAANETGWVKVRDQIVLPLVIQGAIYAVKLVLNKTVEKTVSTN